jgi:colanic acid biosynthesis protein WcaH
MAPSGYIPAEEWEVVVRNVPVVSVDLVVTDGDAVILGKRTNEPAKDEWFVPGGRVRKNETLDDAVHRLAAEELGVEVVVDRRLGAYEHRYDAAELDGVDTKHYVAIGYLVSLAGGDIAPDDQHSDVRRVEPPFGDLHPYVEAYLRDAGITSDDS